MNLNFSKALIEKGWTEVSNDWEYRKNSWRILRDTGSWWMIYILDDRIFDFPEPTDFTASWTVNLIDYLCSLRSNMLP